MLEMANPGKLRPPSEPHRKTADPTPVKLEIEDQLEDEYGPLDKKSRMPSHFQQWDTSASMAPPVVPYDLLDEPSPLGLRLRKSPSLLDLIQMRLSQGDSASTSCITSCENAEVGKKDLKSTAASGSIDKMKASNFPATLLRIGTWECVSRYEGDLVAKCYYAKHKLVWEVLEGGLKSKIEVQWSDITSLKATCPENGPGTLDIVLARQPLFFRETNPQPRKHTLWQTTADFTKGQASICRRHFLECAQGLLNKHFEKLIQCDPRLNALSRQPDIMLESLYFEPRCSVFEDQDEYKCHASDNLKDGCGPMGSMFRDLGSPSVAPSVCTSEARDPIGRTPDNLPQGTPPTSAFSGMDAGAKSLECRELKVPGLRASMSMSDLVSHMENCISGNTASDNPFLSADGSPNKGMLEELTQYLLSDSQMSSTSDEQSLMFRVNSLRCLLQKDEKPAGPTPQRNHPVLFDLRGLGLEEDDASAYKQPPPSISRKESFGELLMHLPRIASLPHVLFNITEDTENRE